MPVIVEGVETAHQANILKACGFDFAQGFHYGRPQTMTALTETLAATAAC